MIEKRVLVTGGAGFIGSHVTDMLVTSGVKVVVLDNLSTGFEKNVPIGAELVVADIRSQEASELVARFKPEIIFHFAAQMDVRKSVFDPSFDADVNIRGPLNLLEAGRGAGLKKVIFSSTGGAIYGEQHCFPADESHAQWPISPYGVAKLALEKYLYYYHDAYGIDAVCLRYANVYGPRQNSHGEAGVIAIFLMKLLRGESPIIYGDGEITRDFVFVGDVVQANLAALKGKGFCIYNVGTGIESSINDVYAALNRIVGTGHSPIYEAARPGEQRRSSISAAKIERELGVAITTKLEDGLQKTVAWFRQ